MRYLTIAEVLTLHRMVIFRSGGSTGIRDMPGLESAIAQPQGAFQGSEHYPSVAGKATALCFSLIRNHPFVDGNKRVGHAAWPRERFPNPTMASGSLRGFSTLLLAPWLAEQRAWGRVCCLLYMALTSATFSRVHSAVSLRRPPTRAPMPGNGRPSLQR